MQLKHNHKNLSLITLALFAGILFMSNVNNAVAEEIPAGFRSEYAEVNGIRLHYVIGGKGSTVVLIHGWPETWYAWRKVMPVLARSGFEVIVPDMRGFGLSARPAGGYDRKTMADDIYKLVHEKLGRPIAAVVGHDWGGSTAAAYAISNPKSVSSVVVIEAQPRGPWSRPEPWFYAFHKAPGFAEAMTAGREQTYLTYFYRNFAARPDAISPEEIKVYLQYYGSPEGMKAGFELVRALPKDITVNAEAAKTPTAVPVLAIGGDKGMGTAVEENLQPLFTNVRGVVLPNTGHFVPEEQPQELGHIIVDFLKRSAG